MTGGFFSSVCETKVQEKKEGPVEKASGKEAIGNLSVTDVKMISETCTKWISAELM